MADKIIKLANVRTGEMRQHELQRAVDEAWQALLAEPRTRAEVAAQLGVPVERLGDGREAPVRFETLQSNMSGGELALIVAAWAAKDILLGVVSDEIKGRLRGLIEGRLLPMVRRRPGGKGAVGPLVITDEGDRD
ncbi:MAG TPA: hypothetical protein VIP05_15720 [Burkholderiaceae bacterium]